MVTGTTHPVFNARVGGRLSLDFVNTVRARMPRGAAAGAHDFQDAVEGERLTGYPALLEWAAWAGLLPRAETRALRETAAARPRDAAAVHTRALRLREAIYRLCKAHHEGWSPLEDDLAVLNREVRSARTHQVVVAPPGSAPRRGAPFQLNWTVDDDRLDRFLWPIALEAAALLTSDELRRVGQCPAVGCGWLFLDTSRSGRRQWCDMAVCGNAEKVRRFRQRHRARRRAARPLR